MVRDLIRRAEPDEARRPPIIIAGTACVVLSRVPPTSRLAIAGRYEYVAAGRELMT